MRLTERFSFYGKDLKEGGTGGFFLGWSFYILLVAY